MKVVIFALVAALCLAHVSANAVGFEDLEGLEYVPETFAEDVIDIENLTIFTGFYWIARASLRTLKGVNCTIKQVIAIKAAALGFLADINACGAEAISAFTDIIVSVQKIVTTCDNIVHLHEQVCNTDESTTQKKTSLKCFFKLLGQLNTLYKQTQNTVTAIKKVPSVPSDIATCTTTATSELVSVFTSFPSTVKTCSKLTSN